MSAAKLAKIAVILLALAIFATVAAEESTSAGGGGAMTAVQATDVVMAGGNYTLSGTTDSSFVLLFVVSSDGKVTLTMLNAQDGKYKAVVPIASNATSGQYFAVALSPGKNGVFEIDTKKYMSLQSYDEAKIKAMVEEDMNALKTAGSDDSYAFLTFKVTGGVEASGALSMALDKAAAVAKDMLGNVLQVVGDKIEVTKTGGAIVISFPVKLETGRELKTFTDPTSDIKYSENKVTIPLKSTSGEDIAEITATAKEATGTGDKAQVKVEKLQLQTKNVSADLTSVETEVGKVDVKMSADLTDLPSDASIKVRIEQKLTDTEKQDFDKKAAESGYKIGDVAYGVDVEKTNLDATNASVTLKVGKEWADANQGKVRIFRSSDGKTEILPTKFVSYEGDSAVFAGTSENGLSVFALAAVESATPTSTQKQPAFEFAFAIAGLLLVGYLIRKR